jgi:hypothetical protein
LANLRKEVEELAWMGSWQANKWLGDNFSPTCLTSETVAARFFFGDVQILDALTTAYEGSKA